MRSPEMIPQCGHKKPKTMFSEYNVRINLRINLAVGLSKLIKGKHSLLILLVLILVFSFWETTDHLISMY